MRDSFDDLKLSVECHIQDLNNISQIPSDFELDFDILKYHFLHLQVPLEDMAKHSLKL